MHLEIAFCIISYIIPTIFIEYIFFTIKDVLSNTHKPYKIHYFNLKCIIRERAMKVEIFKMHLEMTFFAYFLMNTKNTYRIHYVNHIHVNRGHWHSKKKTNKKFLKR